MPVNTTYPGVYIDEVKSSVRTITGVPTSIAAFVGYAPRGPVDRPVHITSWADYENYFGGLAIDSPMSYAVSQFYLNGGNEAEIVRIEGGAAPLTIRAGRKPKSGQDNRPTLKAASPGSWARNLRVRVDYDTAEDVPQGGTRTLFNLTVRDAVTGVAERYLNVSSDPGSPRSLEHVLASSQLVVLGGAGTGLPDANDDPPTGADDPFDDTFAPPANGESPPPAGGDQPPPPAGGDHPPAPPGGDHPAAPVGNPPAAAGGAKQPPVCFNVPDKGSGKDDTLPTLKEYSGSPAAKTGIHQLLKTDIFNMLCLPDATGMKADGTPLLADATTLLTSALQLCVDRRAILFVDPPTDWPDGAAQFDKVVTAAQSLPLTGDSAKNAAIYYPRVMAPDLLRQGAPFAYPPCGVMAGVHARTDVQRGVWKAAAGTDASLNGVSALEVPLTDLEIGRLNPLGVNCLRLLPAAGPVAWGARTMRGADRLTDEWKYLPVRRLALFVEESLFRGTQWVVFEPNDEPLWASIRLNVGAFMNSLFREGAFQGRTPSEAYLVKCDRENNPQNDIDRGIVNIQVGFAPLKPAEFVIIHIQQLAGQIQV